ncbi:Pre-rRNA-processing protein ESF2 [Ceratocystis platani]|uniref:18S rRNA factor 2 n=1 Tax=Ceratocystis fimbriata f. sp. platani TaxID=88771 RepID=A0A0F8CPK4_CERFI|nr:Pre-rRNA-processing protein ESF2 [Ceratocystis platani]
MPADDKRNPLLDNLNSDDDDDNNSNAHDSETEDLRKGRSLKTKRRRESDASSDSEVDGAASDSENDVRVKGKPKSKTKANDDDDESDNDAGSASDSKSNKEKEKSTATKKLPAAPKQLAKKNLIATEEAINKSGVLYISRIPPFMKPHKLRTLLEPYGAINRTFLMPEDPTAHARRVRAGGNKKRLFTEGWVEFVSKKDAKRAHALLNARTIGGKKGSYYRDDVWSLVYLRGFKWRDLMGQIAGENAERASRMQAEISKAARENKEFVRNVERAKMLDGMQAQKRRRLEVNDEDRAAKKPADEQPRAKAQKTESRTFRQTAKVVRDVNAVQPASVSRALSKIF